MNQKLKGYVLVVVSAVMWGTIPLFTRYLYQTDLAPIQVSAMRSTLAALLSVTYLLVTGDFKKFKMKDLPFYLLYGALSISMVMVSYATAIKMLSTAVASILLYTAPAFVIIFDRIIYKEPLTKPKLAALFMTFFGCALVVNVFDVSALKGSAFGIFVGLLAGIGYSLVTVFGVKGREKYEGKMNGLLIQITGCILLFAFGRPWTYAPSLSGKQWLFFLGLALVSTFLPYFLYLEGIGTGIDGGVASILSTLEPVVATLLGVLAFADRITPLQYVGVVVVLSGGVIPILAERKNG